MFNSLIKLFFIIWMSVVMFGFAHVKAFAQSDMPSLIPAFGDQSSRLEAPKTETRKQLLFLTTIDFPPFNFVNDDKQLVGFHVDLVRALCDELNYQEICQIQALPWQELEQALTDKKGQAIISGIAMTGDTRAKFLFTNSYFQFPARFLIKKDNPNSIDELLSNKGNNEPLRIATLEGGAHQAYAKAYFKNEIHIAYGSRKRAMEALNKGEVMLYFDDGLSLARQLDDAKKLCDCEMRGAAYFSRQYFGSGLAIALAKGDLVLKTALDWALSRLQEKGVIQELYLRYFPIGIY